VGSEGDLCEWTFLGNLYQVADIIKKIQDANQGGCNTDIYYDFDYGVHFWSDCECGQIKPFMFEGVTTETYKFNSSAKLFYADFPTASPYVTSVGATVFKSDDGKTVKAEHACSIVDGGIITTGGGFSDTDARPSWQAAAVDSWDQNAPAAAKPPSNQYNVKSRGYPDVSLNGHNYAIYSTSTKSNANAVAIGHVDGTSASSPALAGLISLINGARLDAGKSAVGFVNPLLYSMYAAQPQNFHDITFGDNKCTRNFCMEYGYNATQGWDPVGGLGSIDYTALKTYAMAQ
jgi:tripeptidyl-peptidase-1